MKATRIIPLIGLITLILSSCTPTNKLDIAQTHDEFLDLIKNPKSNIIHNVEDFDRMIEQEKDIYKSLDQETIQKFKRELKFNNGGLSTANYDIISLKLSKPSFIRFWELFGISDHLFKDYDGMYCQSKGTCASAQTYVCTSNC